MRNKYQATLAVGFVGLFCLATACGDDGGGTPSGNEAGESGAGPGSGGDGNGSGGKSSAGSGGKSSAGNGGAMSSNGGEPMGDAGTPSGTGGQASGDGGKPSSDGGEPSGGNASGSGGEPSGHGGAAAGAGGAGGAGGASDSGPVECIPITLQQFGQAQVELSYAVYVTSFTPNIGAGTADNFRVAIQGLPYDGDRTGTFDLTQNGDGNYETCARCLLVYADGNQKIFYPSEGTLQIAPGSKQLGGTIDATITNLKLVEVTIASNLISTPVPNGACLTVASAAVQVEAPPCGGFECNNGYCVANSAYECDEQIDCPDDSDEFPVNASCDPVWLCPQAFYDDGDCDCGCGIQDIDCTGTTDENECEFCSACQGNVNPCGDNQVDPADTTQCL